MQGDETMKEAGMTREELDKKCICGHTREFHTVKAEYCFTFNDKNKPCQCRQFKENHLHPIHNKGIQKEPLS